jgi:hypothetical protein
METGKSSKIVTALNSSLLTTIADDALHSHLNWLLGLRMLSR